MYISLNSELETIQEIVAQGKQFIEQFGTCSDFSEDQKNLYKYICKEVVETSFKLETIFEKYVKCELIFHADSYYFSREYDNEFGGVYGAILSWLDADDINVPPNDNFIEACEKMVMAYLKLGTIIGNETTIFAMCRFMFRITSDDYYDLIGAQLKGQAQRV